MRKKLVALSMAVLMLAVAVIGGTLAYFTDTQEATNTFTVGNVDITLTEPHWEGAADATGKIDAPEVYPGEALAKDPTVENTGANPCFVRIKVEGLDCLDPAGEITLRTNYQPGYRTADWTKKGDYYYYNGVLAVGAKTSALFDQIVIPTDLENGDAEEEFDIDVTAEAVQAQGAKARFGTGAAGETNTVMTMTVDEIAVWFNTCMAG